MYYWWCRAGLALRDNWLLSWVWGWRSAFVYPLVIIALAVAGGDDSWLVFIARPRCLFPSRCLYRFLYHSVPIYFHIWHSKVLLIFWFLLIINGSSGSANAANLSWLSFAPSEMSVYLCNYVYSLGALRFHAMSFCEDERIVYDARPGANRDTWVGEWIKRWAAVATVATVAYVCDKIALHGLTCHSCVILARHCSHCWNFGSICTRFVK